MPTPTTDPPDTLRQRPMVGTDIRLRTLHIHNFKALEDLPIEFPPPRMPADPDVFVMGSRNGLGKTSVLESCALLFLAAYVGEKEFPFRSLQRSSFNPGDLLVRAGQKEATIEGGFTVRGQPLKITIRINRHGYAVIRGDVDRLREAALSRREWRPDPSEIAESLFFTLIGMEPDPLLLPPFLYFHSYRKVQEGSPELGMMVESERFYRRRRYRPDLEGPISRLKIEILRSLMSRGGLFENLDEEGAEISLSQLNLLMQRYARGRIEKLRPSPDNTVEFRIKPTDRGPSFSFDGLSSGQKEIISTLFLIWKYTASQQGVVLIDEPELHLNPEWHRSFIQELNALAPQNQYILATHSEDVFESVDANRRILLVDEGRR